MSAPERHPVSEPKLILLVLGTAAVLVLCVIAIIETGDAWLGVLTVLAMGLLAGAIILDLRAVMAPAHDVPEFSAAPPGRCVVVSTAPMTAPQVLGVLGPEAAEYRHLMVVAPEGLGGHDSHAYDRAHRAESVTVAALRQAGLNAAGQVGDRNPQHAIENALALFPAARVLVVAHGTEVDLYREHVDVEALSRRTGAEVQVLALTAEF